MAWRDIKTDPPENGAVVVATDGKMVIAGKVKRYEKHPELDAVTGANLQTGHACMWYFEELTGWMPPPATWGTEEKTFPERTADIIAELKSMMGKKMHYGEMVGAEAPYCHCGPMVYEDPEDYCLEKAVEILERMLAGDYGIEPPEKTGDKILREIGYGNAVEIGCGGVRYDSEDGKTSIVITPAVAMKGVYPHGFGPDFTKDEILACAKLIREMEAKENG